MFSLHGRSSPASISSSRLPRVAVPDLAVLSFGSREQRWNHREGAHGLATTYPGCASSYTRTCPRGAWSIITNMTTARRSSCQFERVLERRVFLWSHDYHQKYCPSPFVLFFVRNAHHHLEGKLSCMRVAVEMKTTWLPLRRHTLVFFQHGKFLLELFQSCLSSRVMKPAV